MRHNRSPGREPLGWHRKLDPNPVGMAASRPLLLPPVMYSENSCMFENLSSASDRRRCLGLIVLLLFALFLGTATGQSISQSTEPPKQVPGVGATVQDQPTP